MHRATLIDGREVAVKIQYPGVAEALEADLRNAGMLVRLAKALAPGLDAKAVAEELRERVLEELDYEYEAQNQRTFARAYRDHPFIYVPDVITRLSRRRVLVTEFVEGRGFERGRRSCRRTSASRFGEIVFRFCFGSIYHLQHFNADAHPGNYILMDDGRVAFLDFGMTKKLDLEQIELEQAAIDAASRKDPEALREAPARPRLRQEPVEARRRAADGPRDAGRRLVPRGRRVRRSRARRVMKVIESTSDPRSEYYDLMRRESVPAEELMGRRMETGRARRPRPARRQAQLAPDHARVGLRRRARDRARPRRSGSTSSRAASGACRATPAGRFERLGGLGRGAGFDVGDERGLGGLWATPRIATISPTIAITPTTRKLNWAPATNESLTTPITLSATDSEKSS